MNTQKSNSLGPFAVLTFIYFIVGFLTTVNGQFQGPLKIAFLSHADELRNTLTTLIPFFFFSWLSAEQFAGREMDQRPWLQENITVCFGGDDCRFADVLALILVRGELRGCLRPDF